MPLGPVDNLLAAASVAKQKAAGAMPLRVECDFVVFLHGLEPQKIEPHNFEPQKLEPQKRTA
jgi:hypothetical protein